MADIISVETALAKIKATTKPLPIITLPISKASGHVLAQDAFAKITLPPLDASAMDGYAVKLENHHKQGSVFTLIGESPAGAPYAGEVGANETVRIFTGGAVPKGANHVIMQENISANGTQITLTEPIFPASHIRKAGIDFKTGDNIASAGTLLNAYHIAILAASNHGEVQVYKKPVIALLANGDELFEPGSDVPFGGVISSNPYALAPLLESWGAEVILTGISKDDPDAIKKHIQKYANADMLVPIGGASVGDRDYMKTVFAGLGYTQVFSKAAVKPGKPVWFGTLDKAMDKTMVLGLPGNPASALVTAHIFIRPLIAALTQNGEDINKTIAAKTTADLKPCTWRAEYIRAHAVVDKTGQITVTPYPRQDSSLLTPFITANCFLVRQPNDQAAKAGDIVSILMISAF